MLYHGTVVLYIRSKVCCMGQYPELYLRDIIGIRFRAQMLITAF